MPGPGALSEKAPSPPVFVPPMSWGLIAVVSAIDAPAMGRLLNSSSSYPYTVCAESGLPRLDSAAPVDRRTPRV
jgi:hypothetical protein